MSYTVDRLIDVIENVRPKPRSCVKFPCGICNKSVKNNHKAIQCDSCDLWIHIGCNDILGTEYERLKTDDDPWYCLLCVLKYNLDNVPFTRCDNSELSNINISNSMRFLESLPNVEIVNDASQFSNVTSNEASIEIPSKSCSKYYSIKDFKILNISKSFNIFHSNINGLESKLDNLYEFLSGTSNKIDILTFTEISEKEAIGFISNVEIDGYQKFHTPSKSSKGGTAIHVNKYFDSMERSDLNINSLEYESSWIEIKNTRSKNIVIASIYRHPHNNFNEFFQYLESCLSQVTKENKELYICGDFNFDLLKIDTDHYTQHFFNLLCSYGFLPHILQPTRVTDNTASVIDNIFSNNIQDNIICGNILLTLSEHFSQFLFVERENVDLKEINIYLRDYSTFSSESFRDDVSIQNWVYSHDNIHDSFNDFYNKLEGSVNKHAPLKKLSPKEIKLKNIPWLSAEIQKLIKIRNKVFARKKRQPNNESCKRLYNLLRNRVNREIKKSKKQYYADYFAANVNNIKKTWVGIRKIVNIKKTSIKTSQLNIGGKIIVDDKDLATNFNDFFC